MFLTSHMEYMYISLMRSDFLNIFARTCESMKIPCLTHETNRNPYSMSKQCISAIYIISKMLIKEFEHNACLRFPKPYPFLTLIAGLHLRYFLRRSYRSVSFSHSMIDWYWSSFRQKATVSRQTSMWIRGLLGSRIGREEVFRLSLTWALTGDKM